MELRHITKQKMYKNCIVNEEYINVKMYSYR